MSPISCVVDTVQNKTGERENRVLSKECSTLR